jgi:hypothetical protein
LDLRLLKRCNRFLFIQLFIRKRVLGEYVYNKYVKKVKKIYFI